MESELRSLIGKYGMRAVHEGLMKEMRDTFQYLQDVFAVKNEIVTPAAPVPTLEIVNDFIPDGISHITPIPETDSLTEVEEPEVKKDPTVKEVVIFQPAKTVTKQAVTNVIEVKQQKAKHKEEVEKKKQELLAKGIRPESLVTEANLRKWLGDGWSYMKIAKETGVNEVQVANTAKSFGLQSNISKYVGMKKK